MDNIRVSDVMTRNVIPARPDDNILECAKKMVRKKVGGLILSENKNFKGYVSTQDILWALIKNPKADFSKIKAIDISPKKIITIKSSATIKEAIDKIKKFRFYRIPVIDNGKTVGIITIRDIISFYPEADSELKEIRVIREEAEKIKRIGHDTEGVIRAVEDGICEECGARGELYRINGALMCSSCSASA